MEKKDDASLGGSQVTRLTTRTHTPYIQMVQKALIEHGGDEGLTAEEINKYLIAANYDLPPYHDRSFLLHLNQLTQRNKIIQDPSSGRYTIPGRAEVKRLTSQAEEVLCKLKKAEDQYIKNLAGPFVKDFHLSKIKKLEALLAEATASGGHGEFKVPSLIPGESKKPNLTHGEFQKPTFGEMSPDPGHGGPGPTAGQSGDERPDPSVNPAENVSRSGPIEPSQAAPQRPPNKPGRWVKRKSLGGKKTFWFKIPGSERK